MRVQFGEFVLDTGRQELTRLGEPVHLTAKELQLLAILVEARPNVVSYQELYDRVWPDVIVNETNLKNLLADLRRTLDDRERKGRFLRTVHGRGYAFSGWAIEKRETDPVPTVIAILFHGPRRIVLHGGANVIGRGEDADAVIDHPEISRHHARVTIGPRSVTIEDLDSKNGTFVGDKRIGAAVELHDADVVRLGTVALEVQVILRSVETKTAKGS